MLCIQLLPGKLLIVSTLQCRKHPHVCVCMCADCLSSTHVYNDQVNGYVDGKHLSPPTAKTPHIFSCMHYDIFPEGLPSLLTSQKSWRDTIKKKTWITFHVSLSENKNVLPIENYVKPFAIRLGVFSFKNAKFLVRQILPTEMIPVVFTQHCILVNFSDKENRETWTKK